MKTLISVRMAGNILLICLGMLAVFHVLVLLKIVPSDAIWGGRTGAASTNLLLLESIALAVTALFALIVAAKVGYLNVGRFKKATDMGVWLIFAYLLLNTAGNLASTTAFEKFIFAPLTLLLALCALRLALAK